MHVALVKRRMHRFGQSRLCSWLRRISSRPLLRPVPTPRLDSHGDSAFGARRAHSEGVWCMVEKTNLVFAVAAVRHVVLGQRAIYIDSRANT
jgi:hypothetical protein